MAKRKRKTTCTTRWNAFGARSEVPDLYFKKSLKMTHPNVSAHLLHVRFVTYKQIHIRTPSAIYDPFATPSLNARVSESPNRALFCSKILSVVLDGSITIATGSF